MMWDMVNSSLNQFFQRYRPDLRMDAPALEILGLQGAKNPCHLLADQFDQ
jgi:hypothetical protein